MLVPPEIVLALVPRETPGKEKVQAYPDLGYRFSNSIWWLATGSPSPLKMRNLDDVVPWSMLPTNQPCLSSSSVSFMPCGRCSSDVTTTPLVFSLSCPPTWSLIPAPVPPSALPFTSTVDTVVPFKCDQSGCPPSPMVGGMVLALLWWKLRQLESPKRRRRRCGWNTTKAAAAAVAGRGKTVLKAATVVQDNRREGEGLARGKGDRRGTRGADGMRAATSEEAWP
jgi:hypothetical protein